MFLDLFYGLRPEGVPLGIQEWQTFLRALEQGLHGSSLLRFYHLGRACLIKSETYFDHYDRVFARVFKGVEGRFGDDVTEQVMDWLKDPKNFPELSPEEWAALERLSSERDALNITWGQDQLEQGSWSNPAIVERVAADRRQMVFPRPDDVEIVAQ